ncbi:hypothetical protein GCM10023215_19550 [Pseudonocardia yuanmonensis]|uniref:Uncharacterized protein n=1 Tax=Pseudonocardia yuanmonensis TaxID=1095914 RepID=A0ABP8WBR7_9PSEU
MKPGGLEERGDGGGERPRPVGDDHRAVQRRVQADHPRAGQLPGGTRAGDQGRARPGGDQLPQRLPVRALHDGAPGLLAQLPAQPAVAQLRHERHLGEPGRGERIGKVLRSRS